MKNNTKNEKKTRKRRKISGVKQRGRKERKMRGRLTKQKTKKVTRPKPEKEHEKGKK